MKRVFLVVLSSVFLPLIISAYTKDDAVKGVLNILEQNGYSISNLDEAGPITAEKDHEGFIIQLTVRLMKKDQDEFYVSVVYRLPDQAKYSPEQAKEAHKVSKEQIKMLEALIKKRFNYFKALDKYVKSHYGLTPETIELMKNQELAIGLTFDQASLIIKEKYYRYENWQTVSTLLTGLANILDAAAGGSGNKYQEKEFDNEVHCKTSKVADEKNPGQKITVAYYYYRDPKSNKSFWLNGQYVNVRDYNAEAGETPILRLYFEDNKLTKWEDLLFH
jgi:hypothetical protein